MTVRHINQDYKIIIKLCVLSKIPIIKVNITKTRLEKLKLKGKIKEIDFRVLQDNKQFDKKILKVVKKANIEIQDINLRIDLGTENAALTSMIVPVLSTIIAIILRKKVKKCTNQIFQINPIYMNRNLINIVISSIFEIKMIHIITIIYILNQKEGVEKYERTSNRGAYDYSYE